MTIEQLTPLEFEAKCKELCPHCAVGEVARQRIDTLEWVHDFSFGNIDPNTMRKVGFGHGLCLANDFRKQNGQP